jgi:uncharacterized protein YegP (UPF0339 family)
MPSIYKFVIKKDAQGQYRWNLVATNGRSIGTAGEGYHAKSDCVAAINSIKKNGPGAPISELKPKPPGKRGRKAKGKGKKK